MSVEQIVQALQQVGFPILVATYLLLRLERTLKELAATLGGLRNTLAIMNQPWNGMERRRRPGAEGTRPPWQAPTGTEGRP